MKKYFVIGNPIDHSLSPKLHNYWLKENNIDAIYDKKKSGSFGDISAFSTHPLKNLNACGDGGFIITNNKKLYNFIKLKRNHGHITREKVKFFGTVSRLDSIQAVILNFRLKKLENIINKRLNEQLSSNLLSTKKWRKKWGMTKSSFKS